MNLLPETKKLCQAYDIKPTRSKGQNFLINEEIYDDIVLAAQIKEDDTILEVGPGLGFLTAKLANKAKKVIAVELDDKLSNVLEIASASQAVKNVEIINKNILDVINNKDLPIEKYKVVANLPYNITSVFLRKILEQENKPKSLILMLQKEVAERIVAVPPKMSLLAVSVQFFSQAEIVQYVNKENFWPQPEVDSAVIKLKIKNKNLKINERDFFRLVKFGFSSKRKMLKNNLAGAYNISQDKAESLIKKAGLSPKIRAQELSLEDWKKLLEVFNPTPPATASSGVAGGPNLPLLKERRVKRAA